MGVKEMEADLSETPAPSATGLAALERDLGEDKSPTFLEALRTDPRNAAAWAFDLGRQGVTKAAAGLIEGAGNLGAAETRAGFNRPPAEERISPESEALARAVVPQTPMEAGMMAGTVAAGPLVGLAARTGLSVKTLQAYPWLARVLGAGLGGEAGADITGTAKPGAGALTGVTAAGTGELGAGGGAKLYRSTAAGARAIARADAARVGKAMEEAAPTLQPGRTAEAMQRTAEGPGLARIGAGKEAVVSDVENALSAAGPQTPHFTNAQGQGFVRLPQGGWAPARQAGEIPIPSLGKNMTLRDANAELSSIGDQMRGFKPLDPRFPKDANLKEEYGKLADEIRDGIAQVAGPDVAAQFATGQAQYRAGRNITNELLERPTLFRQGQFTAQDLQRWLRDPTNRADLARSLGGDLATGQNLGAYTRLVDAIQRGAPVGMVDELAGQAPGLLSGRGSYGAWRAPVEAVRALFPNASTKYVGRVPYTPPENIRTLIDLMAERGTSEATR